jgi:cytochrome c oxidase subunit 3
MTILMSSRGAQRRGDLSLLISKTSGIATLPPVARNDGGGERPKSPLSNGLIGMMLLVGTETVLFTCFISAYMILRMGAPVWPPLGTPRLSLGLSSFNTVVLILSAGILAWGRHSGESRNPESMDKYWTPASAGVTACLVLGSVFLFLQGVEFHQLYARGLTLKTGPYGAVFFCLVSCHGLHVIGGLIFLAALLLQIGRDATPLRLMKIREWIGYSELYWYFVTAVWLVLFGILYLV